ncbi:hypothetical protein BsWGS_18265 [Bradybaena similaris]
MAHRSFARETSVGSGFESEGFGSPERPRVTRRGQSATPGLASQWEENRRLYMDNLRLWDCLTLVRSDPTVTCQNAIKLVFNLDDEEYFRMFPDTRQLMLLMFPGGVVFHSSSEESKMENARLKDENARLHAAVWVLRDNPTFQADSTVAAIFRLNEEQFQSKFHSVNVATLKHAPTNTPSKVPYRNKEKKQAIRTSLGLAHEPTMAVPLSNCPFKTGSFACDKRGSKVGRQPRSQSMIPPSRRSQNSSVCTHHQDFTSNWKPTTPLEEPAGSKIKTSEQSHLENDWKILCWRQNNHLRPVDMYAQGGTKPSAGVRHGKSAQSSSQKQSSSRKERHTRRSNSVSREDNLAAERFSKGPSHAAPVKCVSFAEPLPSYQMDPLIATKSICLKDKVGVNPDTPSDNVCTSVTQEKIFNQCPVTAGEAEMIDIKQNADVDSAKKEKSNKRGRKSDKRSRVYTLASAREPSKRCQKDTATSPVLDTRTCLLVFAKSGRPEKANNHVKRLCSASDDYILNKSNNNDTSDVVGSPQCSEANAEPKFSKCPRIRPLSPKQRNLRQARLKNMLACQKLNADLQNKQTHDIQGTCSTNNALNEGKCKFSCPKSPGSNTVIWYSLHRGNEIANNDEEYASSNKCQSTHSSNTSVSNATPLISFSDTPALPRKSKHCPYSIATYTTVKQFINRHQNLLQGVPLCVPLPSQEDLTEETPSATRPSGKKLSSKQESEIVPSGADTGAQGSISSRHDGSDTVSLSQHLLLAQKHKEKWSKSETPNILASKPRTSVPRASSITTGKKLKLCEEIACNTEERLQHMKRLGNYKYSKPLATMFKRNGCLKWRAQDETPKRTINLLLNSSAIGSRLQSIPLGAVITFTPKK